MTVPLRFSPFLRPMVWGGRRLEEVLGRPLPSGEPYGESWEISDHPLHRSVVAAGPLAGQTLRALMEQRRSELLGALAERYDVFPWLVKFLDARDWLSVQVHPDDRAVKELWPGEGGKTEAWIVLDAAPGSRIYAGLLPGVDEPALRRALARGTVAECLAGFSPRPGDCVFLPAGTVHAVGGGVLLAEVQQTSDATFRLFDWNRRDGHGNSRPLHIEQALASIHWDRGPVKPVSVPQLAGAELRSAGPNRQELVRCPYFELEYRHASEPFALEPERGPRVALVVRGNARLESPGFAEEARTGQVWLVPAAAPTVHWVPSSSLGLVVCRLP